MKWLPYLFWYMGGGVTTLLLVCYIIFTNPEKIEIWISLFWKYIKIIFKVGEKQYIAHDIQGHVNLYNRKIAEEIKNFEPIGIKIQWVEKEETEKNFFKDNALIIRMRRSEDQNRNFVSASMIFISQIVLKKTKRYISPTQSESIDLYVGKKLFESEKPEVIDYFLEEFLHKKVEGNKKVSEYFDRFSLIDKIGLFFPILVQELNFLGEKIFGNRRDDLIIQEVNGLIDFLYNYSERIVGETSEEGFNGRYIHCGVMIVAKKLKVEIGEIKPFLVFIEKMLKKGIENIYIISSTRSETLNFVYEVCIQAEKKFNLKTYFEKKYKAKIKFPGKEERVLVSNCLNLLRKEGSKYHYDSEDQKSTTSGAQMVPIVTPNNE